MYDESIRGTWEKRQELEDENEATARAALTNKKWNLYLQKPKCVSCPEDGFQGMLLKALQHGSRHTNTVSLVERVWRAAVDFQLRNQYIMPEKKKMDVVCAAKPKKDLLHAKSYRPITNCTTMYQCVTGTCIERLMGPLQ